MDGLRPIDGGAIQETTKILKVKTTSIANTVVSGERHKLIKSKNIYLNKLFLIFIISGAASTTPTCYDFYPISL
jgi:hypothetical protein